MTNAQARKSLIQALEATKLFRFVMYYDNTIMACGPASDIMCISVPHLKKRMGKFVIYIDSLIMSRPSLEASSEEVIAAYQNRNFLALPYIFPTPQISDLFFEESIISPSVILAISRQINSFSLDDTSFKKILSSKADHPIKAFVRVYGDEFNKVLIGSQ
jgi:hypothetical protein